MLLERRSVTCLTPEYERKLTPLKSLAAATARLRVVTPFTYRLLLTGWFIPVVENLGLLYQKRLYRLSIKENKY